MPDYTNGSHVRLHGRHEGDGTVTPVGGLVFGDKADKQYADLSEEERGESVHVMEQMRKYLDDQIAWAKQGMSTKSKDAYDAMRQ